MRKRWNLLVAEFTHHFPYTVVGSLIAMAGVWWFGTQSMAQGHGNLLVEQGRTAFHLFHPLHICLSAIATTSLFWRYERHVWRAIIVGALGTIIPCGMSDYIFPYIGGRMLGQPMALHMCIVAHPQLFFSFLGLGILSGFWIEGRMTGSHLFSHGAHVLVSSAASLLYLVSFGFTSWMTDVRFVVPTFAIIVLAVWIPCCISDIVVPITTARGHLQHAH